MTARPRWHWSELEPGEPRNPPMKNVTTTIVTGGWDSPVDVRQVVSTRKYQLTPWTGQVFDNNIPIKATFTNVTLWTDEEIAAKRAELKAAGAVQMECCDELGEKKA